ASYALTLARTIADGSCDLVGLEKKDDDEARAELTRVRGVGIWSADIYLLMALRLSDVWPRSDLALAPAAADVQPHGRRPSPDEPPDRAAPNARGDPARRDTAPSTDAANLPAETIAVPAGPELPASPGETRSVEVLVRNDGSATWPAAGSSAVKLSYHLYDAMGKLLAWDGLRTTLPYDIAPGYNGALSLRVALPAKTGVYSIKPDLLRDGQAWFSAAGAVASAIPLRVTADLDAGYGATTAPASIVPGGEVNIDVTVTNTGLRAWSAGG